MGQAANLLKKAGGVSPVTPLAVADRPRIHELNVGICSLASTSNS